RCLSLQTGHRRMLTTREWSSACDRLADLDRRRSGLGVLDLQGGVAEPELVAEQFLEPAAGCVAVRVGCDEHMGRARGKAAGHGPHVEVVDLDHIALA